MNYSQDQAAYGHAQEVEVDDSYGSEGIRRGTYCEDVENDDV